MYALWHGPLMRADGVFAADSIHIADRGSPVALCGDKMIEGETSWVEWDLPPLDDDEVHCTRCKAAWFARNQGNVGKK